MKGNVELVAFNRGLISRLALARVDLKRTALSAEIQKNWMPRALGSMMLRPGLEYINSTDGNNFARTLPFIFSSTDTAQIELTASTMRVVVDDELVTRPAVTAAISNGTFNTDLTGWTDADEVGGVSSWATGGYMSLVGNGTAAAIRRQEITVNETSTLHALRIIVTRGPITLRVGASAGAADYIRDASLGVGTHSITLTPTGNFHIQLSNRTENAALIDSIQIESSGVMELPTPWAEDDLSMIRYDQSGDVLFIACDGYQQRRIERRSGDSWSIILYQPIDGPFRIINTGATTITPSAITGNITLTASAPLFRSTHVGALFKISSSGQRVEESFTAENQFGDPIRVTGIGNSRIFTIEITGTFTATIKLQRSVGEVGAWEDVASYTTAVAVSYNDALDNQIIYYRLGVKTGDYTSGTADSALTYTIGSITGVVRITGYTSELSASAEVLTDLGGTDATETWSEGEWSDFRGWPSAVAIYEGRLWWAGKDKFWGSVTDAFESFDDDFEGDAGPISRSIGAGPVDVINWLIPLQRLMAGTDGAELSCRSTTLDEPLSPTNFKVKTCSTQGSARLPAAKIDSSALFVQRCGSRVYQMEFTVDTQDYQPVDLTSVIPEIGEPGIIGMAVQRQPDTRVHCWRSDGTVAILVFDPAENVNCWVEFETDGEVEDIVVLPGVTEDQVYYTVKRTINGSTVRYREKWALESECRGGSLNKQADSFVSYTGSAITTVTGANHLEGEEVVVWADGIDVGAKTVTSGSFTLDTAATNIVYGLGYQAQWKSSKLAYLSVPVSTALTQRKRINSIGMILADTHAQGIQYGPDFETLDDLPLVEDHEEVDADSIWEQYDSDSFEFPGDWSTDSRVCLVANAPRPATVLALVIGMATHDKL